MPQKVDNLPGDSLRSLDWDEYLNGDVWFWSHEEIEEMGVKFSSLRAITHVMGKDRGVKVKTRTNDDGLYIKALIPDA